MKKLYTTLAAMLAITHLAYGQWARTTSDTTDIYNLNSGKVGIGTNSPTGKLHVFATAEQLRLGYSATKYASFTTDGGGNLTIAPLGGGLNVTGSLSASSGLTSTFLIANGTNVNLVVPSNNASVNQSSAIYQYAGSTTNNLRVAMAAAVNATSQAVNANYSAVIIPSTNLTTASSGTHSWLSSMVVKPIGMVTSGGAPVTNTASLYIDGESNAGTYNYAALINGATYLNRNVADTKIPLIVELGPLSTNNLVQQWRYNGSQIAYMTSGGSLLLPAGNVGANSIFYPGGASNGSLTFGTAGSVFQRNINDAATAFTINQNTGTGNVLDLKSNNGTVLTVLKDGKVGIGTPTPHETLSVNGNIRAKQVKVETVNWPDFVFEPRYQLLSLAGLKTYISKNQHLPEIPSEQEVLKDGLNLGEMNRLLLKKVEELTLYLIDQDKHSKLQSKRISKLEKQLAQLNKRR